ncbi:hypothetical protein Smp_140130 [Schistosoma mansoni]|uniref:hypothetical protein n=1 Tax=Schistosoma mansoni TaxID=6183 RepID=UPI00022C81C5|nr:hypothetical protein Smp_140130 [Schistosoma mansoni]|eukprot:XP_018647128.1 hypothetical protein Smp_140130 [Schistosoma mansoni]
MFAWYFKLDVTRLSTCMHVKNRNVKTEDHLKDYIKGLMTEYVSLRSGTPTSLFTASVMVMLNCCGATHSQSGWKYPKFDPTDVYDNIIYIGINQPIPCCRMNDQLEIINTTCPYEYTIYNSNIGISCDKPFAEEISFYLNIMVFGSISVLLINVIMLCIGVKAVKDFNRIKISDSGVMPRTNVRYAFKGLNAITGVICLATLVVCAIAFWSRIPANFLKSEVKKFKVPLNPNSVVLQSGLNYYIRSFLKVLFSACLIGHLVLVGMFLKDTSSIRKQAEGVLEKLVFSYESLSSLKPSSLLLGWIMVNLKCCGYIDPYDFLDAKSFSSVDIYDGRTYNGLTTPIPCCELNNTYQIIDIGCPLRSSTGPHQYTVGCREVFGNIFVRIVTIFSYSSLLIILLGISMIACCILVLKELWQAL